MENNKNYYAEEITNDKSNKSYWVKLFVQKWIVKLGLSDQPFRIVLDDQKTHKMKTSKIAWKEKFWQIEYKYLKDPIYDVRGTLIHELGHIYLYKILNTIEFVKQQQEIILTPIELKLKLLVNLLEDQFVDYNLSKNFDEFYKVASDNFKKFVIGNRFKTDISLHFAIQSYVKFYLFFNCILREKERNEVKKWVLFNLEVLRAVIIERYKKKGKKFTYQKFNELDKKLFEFNKLKDLTYLLKENSNIIILAKNFEIVKFYFEVVKCLGLFNSNLTKNFLWEKYGIKLNIELK